MDKRKSFWKYVLAYKFRYIVMCFAYFCTVAAQIAIPLLISGLLAGIGVMDAQDFRKGGFLFLLLILAETVGGLVFEHYNYGLSNRALIDAEHEMLQALFGVSYEALSKQNTNYLSQLIHNDIVAMMDFYVEKLPSLVFQAIKLAVIVVMLLAVDMWVGVIAFACVLLYVLIYFLSRRKSYELSRRASAARSSVFAFVTGKLSQTLMIKLNSWQDAIKNEFKAIGDHFVKSGLKNYDFGNAIKNLSNTWSRCFVLFLLVFLYCGPLGGAGSAAVVTVFTTAVLYIQEMFASAAYLLQGGRYYQTYKVSRDRMNDLLDMPRERQGEVRLETVENISLDNVSFSYEGGRQLLSEASCNFTKGNIYTVSGENGVGKTTLFLLMMGILEKTGGHVYWNGEEIENLNLLEMRRDHVGFVNQEPLLMEDTIYNNLFYGRDKKRLSVEALRQYKLLDFVDKKENGYETKINNQTSNLSGGQKQRIAIMRALLRDPDILFFDEPTSALDAEGGEEFVRMLQEEKRKRIIFLISHDEKLLEIGDHNVMFKPGGVVEIR